MPTTDFFKWLRAKTLELYPEADELGIRIQLAAGHTGNIIEFYDSDGLIIAWIDENGVLSTAGAGAHTHVYNVSLTGTVDGVNPTFTLPSTPNPSSSLQLFRNGIRLKQGVGNDYTLSVNTITFLTGGIPDTGDVLVADYTL